MEKRYQVFVSSTYQDLHHERQELIRALLELDCIPAGMELFPASDDDSWTLIKRVIDESDYYLCVSAGRYGSVHPETGISYTEMEYDYAIEKGKPVVAFLHGNLSAIESSKVDNDADKREKLQSFHHKIRQKNIKEYTSADGLASVATRAIVQLMKQKPGVGWVRADAAARSSNENISRLEDAIQQHKEEIATLKAGKSEGTDDFFHDLGRTLRFVNKSFPDRDAAEMLLRIVGAVRRVREQERAAFFSVTSISEKISEHVDASPDAIECIFHLLSDAGYIDIDRDDDLLMNESFSAFARELRIFISDR